MELAYRNFPEALRYFLESIAVDQTPENLRGASEAHLALGNDAEALACAQQSLTLARMEDLCFEEGVTLRTLGRLAQTQANFTAAHHHSAASCTLLQQLGAHYELGRSLLYQARLEEVMGRPAQAHQAQERALAIFSRIGVQWKRVE